MSILTDDIFTFDNLLHALGGAALAAPFWIWNPSFGVIFAVWTVFGLLREQAQSSWSALFKSLHKWLEAIAWGVGGGILMGICNLVS